MTTKETFFLTPAQLGKGFRMTADQHIPHGCNHNIELRISQAIKSSIAEYGLLPLAYDEALEHVLAYIGKPALFPREGSHEPLEGIHQDNTISHFTYVWMLWCSVEA